MGLGCVSLVVGLLAATFALFTWRAPDGFLYFFGEYARYVCAFGAFAAIIFGSAEMISSTLLPRGANLLNRLQA